MVFWRPPEKVFFWGGFFRVSCTFSGFALCFFQIFVLSGLKTCFGVLRLICFVWLKKWGVSRYPSGPHPEHKPPPTSIQPKPKTQKSVFFCCMNLDLFFPFHSEPLFFLAGCFSYRLIDPFKWDPPIFHRWFFPPFFRSFAPSHRWTPPRNASLRSPPKVRTLVQHADAALSISELHLRTGRGGSSGSVGWGVGLWGRFERSFFKVKGCVYVLCFGSVLGVYLFVLGGLGWVGKGSVTGWDEFL